MGHGDYEIGINRASVTNGAAGAGNVGLPNGNSPAGNPVVFNGQNTTPTETLYIVQPGDNCAVIAARLGLTGDAAKEYARNLKAKLQADGAFNEKGWLMSGQKIYIIGDYAEYLETAADYTTNKKEINRKYTDMTTGVRTAPTVQSMENAVRDNTVQHADTRNNSVPPPPPIQIQPPQMTVDNIPLVNNRNVVEPVILPDESDVSRPSMNYFRVTENPNPVIIPYTEEASAQMTDFVPYNQRGRVSMPEVSPNEIRRKPPEPPVPITIGRPRHLSDNGNEFADALQNKDNKENLMAICGLTNEEYNRYAQLALGLAHEETHFDDGLIGTDMDTGRYDIQWRNFQKQVADSVGYIDYQYETGRRSGSKSIGMTQIKYGQEIQNPTIKRQFELMGINSQEDLENSIEKQAIATIIVLNNRGNEMHQARWQNAINTYNQTTGNNLTTDKAIILRYKGVIRYDDLQNGTQQMRIYGANVLLNADKFTIQSGRSYIPKRSKVSRNNGDIGRVIFMPSLYNGNIQDTKAADIAMLERLQKRSLIRERDLLIEAVREGKIAFGGGLTHEEMASLTKDDIALILLELNQYEIQAHGVRTKTEKRAIAMRVEDEFREEYLTSRAASIPMSQINKRSTGYSTRLRSTEVVDERLVANRRSGVTRAHINGHRRRASASAAKYLQDIRNGIYRGFGVEEDKGINPYYADRTLIPTNDRILAETASSVARDMSTGGQCLTGVKLSLETSGVVEKGEIVYPIGHPNAGRPISVPRELYLYFDAHPEKFEEVKYVEIGAGWAREITAADIPNLPAGYIGIFIPGPGYESEAGHAFITSGNGQGYADETDNLRWDNFVSKGAGNGKGENGTFKIYRLRNA